MENVVSQYKNIGSYLARQFTTSSY
jgi:hypothetical protein